MLEGVAVEFRAAQTAAPPLTAVRVQAAPAIIGLGTECVFRGKPSTYSDRSRPLIPIQVDQ